MSLEEGLVAHLRASAAGSHFVNATSPLTWRIYPEWLPESPTYPALRYERISTDPFVTLGGETSYRTVRLQIDVWGLTRASARSAADAVLLALDGVTGSLGATRIHYGFVEQFAPQSEIEGDREDHRVTLDYVVSLTE